VAVWIINYHALYDIIPRRIFLSSCYTWLLHITHSFWLCTLKQSTLFGWCLCGGCSHLIELLLLLLKWHVQTGPYSTWSITLFSWTYPSIKHRQYSVISEILMTGTYFWYITQALPIFQRWLLDSWVKRNQLDATYFIIIYSVLNMFRTSIRPSSGACD